MSTKERSSAAAYREGYQVVGWSPTKKYGTRPHLMFSSTRLTEASVHRFGDDPEQLFGRGIREHRAGLGHEPVPHVHHLFDGLDDFIHVSVSGLADMGIPMSALVQSVRGETPFVNPPAPRFHFAFL